MKSFLTLLLGAALCISGGAVVVYGHGQNAQPVTVDTSKFTLPSERLAEDLQSRFVVIVPQGQLWGFTPDQDVNIKTLQMKSSEDGVIIAVKITSVAKVQAKDSKTAPVTVELSGVAKLHYELIADEWYLADVSSVTLKVTRK